jgi:hypothetical protein
MTISSHAPVGQPPSGPGKPPSSLGKPDPRRTQYLEVRGQVHRKLLTRLNLEKLASAERSRVEA